MGKLEEPTTTVGAPVLTDPREVALAGESWSTPALVEVAGRKLIVAADRAGWIRAVEGRDLSPVWSLDLGAEITASPLLVDLDGDGREEVVIGTHAGLLWALRAEDGRVLWRRRFDDMIRSTPAAVDVDGTGRPTLFVGVYGPMMVALASDGTELWRRRLPKHLFGGRMKRGIVSSPLVFDVDRDGRVEVVVGVRSARLFCLDAVDGSIKWFVVLGYDPDSSPSFALGRDGRPLVIVGGGEHTGGEGDNAVMALDGRDGRRVWTTDVGGGVDSSPVFLDRPGRAPLVVVCALARPGVVALDGWSGALLWRHAFGPTPSCRHGADHRCRPASGAPYFTEHAICRSYTTPLIADLDGDGRFEVVAGSNNGDLVVLDAENGTLRQREATGGMVRGSPVVDDLDGDAFGEVVAVSGDRLIVYRSRCVGEATIMFKGRGDHLGSRTTPPAADRAEPRRAPWYMPLAVFWRLGVMDLARHVLLKIDERILRRFGLRLFRHGY